MAFWSGALAYGGMCLEIAAVVLLVFGPLRRYFLLLLYLLTSLAVSAALAWAYTTRGPADRLYFEVYWSGEFLSDLMLLCLIADLSARALEGNPLLPRMKQLFVLVLVGGALVPLAAFEGEVFSGRWNQSVGQLLNFGAAILNLGLWGAILLTRRRDRQLLLVSLGLGVTVAGAALTLGVRRFTVQADVLRVAADTAYRVCQLAGPLIWCWAFRPARRVAATASAS